MEQSLIAQIFLGVFLFIPIVPIVALGYVKCDSTGELDEMEEDGEEQQIEDEDELVEEIDEDDFIGIPMNEEQMEALDADYNPDAYNEYVQSDDKLASWEKPEGNVVDPVEKIHRDFVAPEEIEVQKESMKSGDQWVQSVYINNWPEMVRDGFLNKIFQDAVLDTDVTVHLRPRDNKTAKEQLQDRIGAIEAELEERKKQGATAQARDIETRLRMTEQMYDLVSRDGMTLFDVSMYINNRAYSRNEVKSRLDSLRSLLERPPANCDVKVATRRQDKGMISASPIGKDVLGKQSPMLGGGVAAMMPFSSSTRIEEGGTDFGKNPTNGSPVIVNRFGRDTGYNMMTIGNIGSGKSFSTKLSLVRTLQRRDDVDVVMLDPLEGFIGVNKALGGNRIVVGGNVGLNPLELNETPAHVLEKAEGSLDPYSGKLKDVMAFFETFFAMRGDDLDDERRGILEKGVQKAYADKGITRDPDTHSRPSPTLLDVMNNLEDMASNPEEYTRSSAEQERDRISTYASDLLVAMQPFSDGGEFENLTKETEIDITESRISYLDLQQQEGSGGTGLMMQLLFNTVYERAKQTKNKMIFVIDEARYIMKDAASLEFLEQAVRHSRHYDLSIQFVTQTVDEFFAQDESEAIANNCALVQLNRVAGLDDEVAINKLGLNKQQAQYVRNATPGDKERGYSEALFGVEGEWYPIHIKASDAEARVVDFDPGEMDRSDLPGYERIEGSEREESIKEAMEVGVASETPNQFGTDETIEDKMEEIDAVGFEEGEEVTDAKAVEEMDRNELIELIKQGDFGEVGVDELKFDELQDAAAEAQGQTQPPTENEPTLDDSGGMMGDIDVSTDSWGQQQSEEDEHTGARVYYVEIDVDKENTDPNSEQMPVVDSLGDAFNVYATDPSELAIKMGNYEVGFDAVISTSHNKDRFESALEALPEVDEITVADITEQIEIADEADGIDASELEQFRKESEETEQSAGNEEFNELKQEVDEYDDYGKVEKDMEDVEFDKIQEDTDEVEFDELVDLDDEEFTFDA